MASSVEMTCSEAIDAYSKRDCVEKAFRSFLRDAVFHSSRNLRKKNRKNYTISAIIKELNKIEAVIDYKTGQYSRR